MYNRASLKPYFFIPYSLSPYPTGIESDKSKETRKKDIDIKEEILPFTEPVKVNTSLNIIKNDPDDNKFLECAAAGKADFIISGDNHLLSLQEYEKIKILKTAPFLPR